MAEDSPDLGYSSRQDGGAGVVGPGGSATHLGEPGLSAGISEEDGRTT